MACMAIAASRASRTIGPIARLVGRNACVPLGETGASLTFGIRPMLGWKPMTPEMALGRRVEPPVSDPIVIGSKRAAWADAGPELDHPGCLVGSHGLRASAFQLNW